MNKKSVKNKEFVMTGQYLGVVEEFLPNKNSTYVKDGEIFSTKTGTTHIDSRKREIAILHANDDERKTVKIGDIIIGTILFVRAYSVGVDFCAINNKLHFNSSYMGNIHVSEISNKYVEKIQDAFQGTDIVRAKVIGKESNEFKLSTVGKNLGIIHADCTICGTTLDKIGFNKLQCSMCGNIENRKLADDYRNVNMDLIL
ncbi:MAG: exosome complex RNA-binding protein Csl4 [Candidatus Lokiarchaeota archaeon]|nr:exosome complex RNA-binding protein Csl4 [Candidatus Lokiarchaeota archaeon]